MARDKTPRRAFIDSSAPRKRKQLATMTARGVGRPSPEPKKRRRPEDIPDLSAEVGRLEADIAEHPFPESTRPRQAPAMTRYHGAPPRPPAIPKDRRRRPRKSRRKPAPLTDPDVLSLTEPNVPSDYEVLTGLTPETQPEIIDLTGDD